MEKENDYLEAVNELKEQYDTCKAEWEDEKKNYYKGYSILRIKFNR